MQSSALVITGKHACEVVTEALPEHPGPGEVRVRNRLGLISPGTELAMFCRTHPGFDVPGHWARYPLRPGYANVGVVEAVGEGVIGLEPGARVMHASTHTTRAHQPFGMVVPVSPELCDERAVFLKLLGIALTPQLLSPVRLGEVVLVVGAGLVGNLAAQLCRVAGAHRVWVAERSAARLALARACGLEDTVDVTRSDLTEPLGSAPPSYVVEAVGSAGSLRAAVDAVAPDGRVIVLSSPRENFELNPYFDVHHRGVSLIGAHEWRRSRQQRAPHDAFLDHLLVSERVRVEPLINHRVPFGPELQSAYEGLRDAPDQWLGVLVDYPEEDSDA